MAKDPKQMTGYLYVLAAAVLWSLIGPFSKICMEEGLAPLEVAFWRALLGGICFFAQTGICGGARIPVKHALFFCLFGVLSISVFFSSLQISIQLSGAAMAMVLLYTAPAWVAVFSRILFHESFSSRKGIALGLALFGTALVCFSGGSLERRAVRARHRLRAHIRPLLRLAFSLLCLGGSPATPPPPCTPTCCSEARSPYSPSWISPPPARGRRGPTCWPSAWSRTYGAYLAYGRSLQSINQVKAAIIGNIEPVLATFWVWLFWNENFSAYGWAGSALVISAVFLLTADRS